MERKLEILKYPFIYDVDSFQGIVHSVDMFHSSNELDILLLLYCIETYRYLLTVPTVVNLSKIIYYEAQ